MGLYLLVMAHQTLNCLSTPPDNARASKSSRLSPVRWAVLLALAVATPFVSGGCSCGGPPAPPPASYAQIVSLFTIGSIALQTDDPKHVPDFLVEMTQKAPEEPAGWANLGLYWLRKNDLSKAAQYLNKANGLDSNNAGIAKLLGLLADRQGDLQGAINHYKKAVELAPDDLKARYSLAQLAERLNSPEGDKTYQEAIEGILAIQPYNLVAQAALARIAAKRGDTESLKKAIGLLEARAATFRPEAVDWLKKVKSAAASGDVRGVGLNTRFMENTLKDNSAYQLGYSALGTSANEAIGDPILQFVKLPPMPAVPAPPDTAISFSSVSLSSAAAATKCLYVGVVYRDETGAQLIATADGHEVQFDKGASLPFPGGPKATPPGPHGVLPIDINFDMKNDLVFAGAGGIKIYLQQPGGSFSDITQNSKLPASVISGNYTGAWTLDVEADGDLDVVLGSPTGLPTVLRNSVDGTWTVVRPFAGIDGMRDFVWADLDGDGSVDASMIDSAGRLHVFANQRAGLFHERTMPPTVGKTVAIAAADVNKDGKLDLLALQADGTIMRISDKNHGAEWDVAEIARWQSPPADLAGGKTRLLVGDLDNNGGVDLIASTASTTQIWLCDEKSVFAPLAAPVPAAIFAIDDIDGKGHLDLLGLDSAGKPVRFVNKGTLAYNWQEMRPRAHPTELKSHQIDLEAKKSGSPSNSGDRRSNSFGIGGEIETRAGLLYQKQLISSPFVHVGLGSYKEVDSVRILWPNGDIRSEFSHLSDSPTIPDSSISLQHRLKGSCPWIFAWNGKRMEFVTDFLWRSPVGLRINAQDTAGIAQTEDWIKIAGSQLAPRDGYYDVRITAELWETHFFDYVRLMTVDHPVGTEIFVDERFSIPPPPLQIYTLTPPVPVAKAIDDNGNDVTEVVRKIDGNYLDTFGRGEYQGITRDHFVEFEVPTGLPAGRPHYLLASGWIHPTDSSINVAISQGKHDPPRGLSLEAQDSSGAWRTVKAGLGFPAGKTKTIVIRLDDIKDTAGKSSAHRFSPPASGYPPPNSGGIAGRAYSEGNTGLANNMVKVPAEANAKSIRRFRLRTNLEIYWDRLAVASDAASAKPAINRLPLESAELRYRGFSELVQPNLSSPELPIYDHVDGRDQRWRDLIGYCTRFGDVRELLQSVDDRYVIMNAGDEMALRFAAQAPPPAGWTRDYVLIGDGWEKDGDLNTAFSKTILPLPFHGQKSYNTPPGRLQDDPVVRRHPQDWVNYHTRYITPEAFQNALRPGN